MQDKIVIFDWGGVILHEFPNINNSRDAITRTLKKYNQSLSADDAYNLYLETMTDENNVRISEQNDIDSKKAWVNRIAEKLKVNLSYQDFTSTYSKEYQKTDYYKDVVEYIYSLKPRCKIGLLSNIIFTCYDTLKKQVDFSKFNYVWLSYEMNCRKPHNTIYIKVENEINIEPNKILFIDDKKENVETAKSRGWNVLQAKGTELDKIKEAVEKFLEN